MCAPAPRNLFNQSKYVQGGVENGHGWGTSPKRCVTHEQRRSPLQGSGGAGGLLITLGECLHIMPVAPGAQGPLFTVRQWGRGPAATQRHSTVMLTPVIMLADWPSHTVGNARVLERTEGTFMNGMSTPTTLYKHLFFLGQITEV